MCRTWGILDVFQWDSTRCTVRGGLLRASVGFGPRAGHFRRESPFLSISHSPKWSNVVNKTAILVCTLHLLFSCLIHRPSYQALSLWAISDMARLAVHALYRTAVGSIQI